MNLLVIRNRKRLMVVSVAMALWLFAAPGLAQQQQVPSDTAFNIQLFQPAPGPLNFFAVESPELGDDMMPAVGLMFYYGRKPFVIMNCNSSDECGDEISAADGSSTITAVENLVTMDVLGSFNFLKYFQVGLGIPITVFQNGQGFETTFNAVTGENFLQVGDDYATVFALGDLRLHLKARFIGKDGEDGPTLGVAIIPTLPLWEWIGYGKEESSDSNHGYGGDAFLSVTAPKVLFGYRFGPLRTAVNLGVTWRREQTLFNLEVGHVLTYSGALGYSVIPEVELIAEIYGNKTLISENFTDAESMPLKFLAGGRFVAGDFTFHVAGGGGIISGVGVPQFEVVAGAAWTPKKKVDEEAFATSEWDVDGDGIDNDVDECPEEPEDYDGYQDEDGCPDLDNDGDGIPDGYDSCPMLAEDMDGFRDDDGCPDLDHDEDGIKEPADKCPNKAEDFDGFEDEDGCPDLDNDGDGIPDMEDYCPNEPEDFDGFEDEDGCPDLDNDADGVLDENDKCPDKPETLNGYKDDDGCPDKGKALVIVTDEKIELKEMIKFKRSSDVIRGDKSFEVLDIVSRILSTNKTIRVSIEGHTDSKGNVAKNRDLSKRRAESVKKYLVDKGVDETRLETVGWGPDQPIESNKTRKGRAANRRVEFIVIRPQRTVIAPTSDEGGAMDFTVEDDGAMDFTAGDGAGDEMDFTIEEESDKGGDDEAAMDFTAE